MESGLEGRNNTRSAWVLTAITTGLNEVRPSRPEQFVGVPVLRGLMRGVSMKSGLVGRNNDRGRRGREPARGVSMKSGLVGRNNGPVGGVGSYQARRLNEVRPSRPEQFANVGDILSTYEMSQ